MSSAGPLDAEDISRCSAAVCSPVIEVGRTYFFLFFLFVGPFLALI